MSPCVVNTGTETGNTTGPTKNSEYAVRIKMKIQEYKSAITWEDCKCLRIFPPGFGVLTSAFSKGTRKQCLRTIARTLMTWLPAILKGSFCETSALAMPMTKSTLRSRGQVGQPGKAEVTIAHLESGRTQLSVRKPDGFSPLHCCDQLSAPSNGVRATGEQGGALQKPLEVRAYTAGAVRRTHP